MPRTAPLCLLVLLAACAAPPVPPAAAPAGPEPMIEETSTGVTFRLRNDDLGAVHEVDAPAEAVRAALPEVFRDLGIAGAGSDAEGRVFGSRKITAARVAGERPAEWVRCGNESGAGPSAANRYRIEMSLLVSLEPLGERTRVTTQVAGSATPVEGTSTGAVLCVSRGLLERRVAELIVARVGVGAPRARAR